MNPRLLCAATGAALVLSACGGGGGGSSDSGGGTPAVSPTADITADNYTTLAEPMVRALLAVDITSSTSLALINGSADRAQAASAGARGAATNWVARVWQWARQGGAGRVQAQQVYVDNQTCGNGGTVRSQVDDADNNEDFSRGDSLVLQFDRCASDRFAPVVNGQLTVRVEGTTKRSGEIVGIDTRATFVAFEPGNGSRLDGSARLRFDEGQNQDARLRIGYEGLVATDTVRQKSVVYGFEIDGNFNGAVGSFVVNGTIGIDGLSYAIDAPQTLVFDNDGRPAGKLRMRDAAGDALQFSAIDNLGFELQFVPAGASAPTHVTPGLTWSGYLGL